MPLHAAVRTRPYLPFVFISNSACKSSGFRSAVPVALFGLCYNYSALGIIRTLTTNYDIKQSQFTKLTSELRASDTEESNKVFGRTIRGWLL